MYSNEQSIPPIKYVDFDGTLSYFDTWRGGLVLGPPIPRMVDKVKKWLSQGVKVVIFSARVSDIAPVEERELRISAIKSWCKIHLGQELEVTSDKKFFHKMYDDRAVSVVMNTGMSREEALLHLIDDALKTYRTPSVVLDLLVRHLSNVVDEQNR